MSRSTISLAGALALVLAGCSETGRLTVLLKDAPAEVDEAWVTIAKVTLQGPGGEVVLRDTPLTTDLLTLANDVQTIVGDEEIAAGTYTQLRFQITGGYLVVGDSIYASSPDYEGLPADAIVTGELRMPSYARSGLKVVLPEGGLVIGPGTTTLVVDFDVAESFGHAAGNSDAWVMHPVVKGKYLEDLGALKVTLALGEGVTLPPGLGLGSFCAVLTPVGGVDIVEAIVTSDGVTYGALYGNLSPGEYDLRLEAPPGVAFTTEPPVPLRVVIAAGMTKNADLVLTGATVGL